ncbi:hypothetical protein AB205_0087340, partial [Aquarana catesbeiana]
MVRDTDMEIHGCLTLKDLATSRRSKGEQDREDRTAHKENMYDRFRISPRIPLKGEPIDLSKQKGLTPEKFPITPVKTLDRPLTDPWTPTANLKMLISVASPEIRDREKKKELFRPIENEPEDIEPDAQQFEAVDDIDELEKRPSRKQKSLGLLCQKFLARYPSYPLSTKKTTISLDEAASSLGVERRRIYDIVNVLESLNLVSRVAKNQYCWHGQHSLNDTLKNLQREGERQNYGAQIAAFQHKDFMAEPKKHCSLLNQGALSLQFSEADCPSASASSRKDKSLRIMSQKFVMLFLVSTTKIITLEIAAKILIEESQDISDHSKFKTKVRRLYDIANVLTSLGLIRKVHVTEERGRKPAFKWIGPTDFKMEGDQKMEVTTTTPSPDSKREGCIATADSSRQRLLRHSSFNHIQAINTVKRKVCSEPSSPHKCQKGLNGFNFFLPASQATGAMGLSQNNLPQVNVPYVMVPSTALAALPFLCSSAVGNQISAVSSGSAINPGSMNYSLPGMPSSHIMFGASPVVSPPQCETSLEPAPALPPVCVSPVPEKLASSTAADSPVCVVQPVSIKPNQSPLTPKSIRPVHKDTFFKTPGSLGVSPALQKNERSLARNSSSAQRRLDICSSSDD